MTELERLVNLVPYLKAHQGVSVEEVARTFGVSPRRVLDDLRILQFVGLPGGLYGDLFEVDISGALEDGHIFARNVDALGRPMQLNHDQVASLLVGLGVVMELGGDDSAARSAMQKLKVLSLGDAPPVDVQVSAGDAAVRAALAAALDAGVAVELTYRVGGRGAPRTATVEPARLRTDQSFLYLDGWSRQRDAWRTWRLDRVTRVVALDEPVAERDVPASLDTWFEDAKGELTVVVTPEGRWCAQYYPTTRVDEVAEGLEVTFPLVSREWGATLVTRLGEQLVRVSDPDIAALARERARQALEAYR